MGLKEKIKVAKRNELLNCAIKIAERVGYAHITQTLLAEEAGVSLGTPHYYFDGLVDVKKSTLLLAIKSENLLIIAQGIVNRDPAMKKVSKELKKRALDYLLD